MMLRHSLLILALLAASTPGSGKETPELISPGEPVDYGKQAFYPKRWADRGVSTQMTPWRGKEVVFLTTGPDFDREVMTGLLRKLDAGWQHYAKLTGRRPQLLKQVDGLPTLAAIPEIRLTCGYGCGHVGATGIELGAFYQRDYREISANPDAIPDYYFYEMGRNYYTFGDRHSLFVTGFAVFMRYVCLDELGLESSQPTRRIIEEAEAKYADTDIPFLKAFTNFGGLTEKQNRLDHYPTDQPVMYASAMLKLRADHGGDAWVGRYFRRLAECPAVRPTDKETASRQSYNWLVAASLAAGQDLSPTFVDRWRMPLTGEQRRLMAEIPWGDAAQDAGRLVQQIIDTE